MNHLQIALFSFSVLIAAVIGVFRIHKIDNSFYPFIFCMWIAGINEIISYLLSIYGFTTTVNNNIYTLLEAVLIIWQFKKWDSMNSFGKLYTLTFILIVLAWIIESLWLSWLNQIGLYFRVIYAFGVVLMSIHVTTGILVGSREEIFKNPKFLICLGYIIFFTFKIITEAFWFYGLNVSNTFSVNVYIIFTWINLFVNLLFGVAVLCIPIKPHYISF